MAISTLTAGSQDPREANADSKTNATTAAEIARHALLAFLRDCNIPISKCLPNYSAKLEQSLKDECLKRGLPGVVVNLEKSILTAVDIGAISYNHCPFDVQYSIARSTLAFFLLDDGCIDRGVLEEYVSKGVTGNNPILVLFADCLAQATDHFTPYAAGAIITSFLSYAKSQLLDLLMEGQSLARGAVRFANHQRSASGIGEAYAMYVFDKYNFPDINTYIQIVPEIMVYIGHVNDLMSFYKEEMAGDRATYVHHRAAASGKDVEEVIHNIGEEIAACVKTIETVMVTKRELDAWKAFKVGYVHFHIYTSRYRLGELGFSV